MYIVGSGQVNDLLEGNKTPHLHESPNQIGQLWEVLTQHYWAEVFLEEVNGQGGRTLESTAMCS